MIQSAEEFVALCDRQEPEAVSRSMHDAAPLAVWMEVFHRYTDKHIDIAQNNSIPTEMLCVLAGVEDPAVRAVVAERRRIPVHLFSILAKDPDSLVRQKIASNGKTPLDILDLLAEDLDEQVSRVAKYSKLRRLR